MPKETAYALIWSAIHQAYALSHRHEGTTLAVDDGSPGWREWLEQTASFAFRGQRGAYTVRKEQIKPGDWYWYAYQRSAKRVRKKYLGKSEALSFQQLEEVATRFNDTQAAEKRSTTISDETKERSYGNRSPGQSTNAAKGQQKSDFPEPGKQYCD